MTSASNGTAALPLPRNRITDIFIAGVAPSMATLFTNPIEMVKSRMQVQGELAHGTRPFRNSWHALTTISRTEGIRGLQAGLGSALSYQMVMNMARLGLYDDIKRLYGVTAPSSSPSSSASNTSRVSSLLPSMAAGATSGAIGAFVSSPLLMMKVRMHIQTKSSSSSSSHSVGYQHNDRGAIAGMTRVWRDEGLRGMFRGVNAAMLRVGIGNSVGLPTYELSKHFILQHRGHHHTNDVTTHIAASVVSGFFNTIAMNPPDVISTRLYNQPVNASGHGMMYRSIADCATQLVRTEGLAALYKGFWPHYLRLAPQVTLTFVFWEQLKLITAPSRPSSASSTR